MKYERRYILFLGYYVLYETRTKFPKIYINENKNISVINSPAGIYLLKVKNRNTRTRCEICSKLTIKTPERR